MHELMRGLLRTLLVTICRPIQFLTTGGALLPLQITAPLYDAHTAWIACVMDALGLDIEDEKSEGPSLISLFKKLLVGGKA